MPAIAEPARRSARRPPSIAGRGSTTAAPPRRIAAPSLASWRGGAVVLLALLVAAPVIAVAVSALEPRWEVWRHLYETRLASLSWNTLRLLLGVAVGAGTLGVSLGWIVAVYRFPGRGFFEWALVLPLAMPAYVFGFVMVALLDFAGPVQTWMRDTFGPGAGLPEIRSYWGVVCAMSLVFYPYVYLLARSAFDERGAELVEASRILGQSPRSTFWRVALPLARPAIAAGLALALMETLADIGTVSLFTYDTFTTAVYRVWFGMFDRTGAGQIALVLMLFAALLVTVERRARSRGGYAVSDAVRSRRLDAGRRAPWLTALCGSVFAISFVLPAAVLVLWSVRAVREGALAGTYPTLVRNTVVVALAASLLTVAAALVLSYAVRRARSRKLRVLTSVAVLGYAVPGTVVALGVLLVLTEAERVRAGVWSAIAGAPPATLLSATVAALLFAYLVRFMAVAFYPVQAGLSRVSPAMDESARALGASPGRVMREVHVPMLRGSLLVAAILVVVEVLKELPATMLIRPFGFETLAVEVWQRTNDAMWTEAAPPSLAIVALGAVLVAWLTRAGAMRGRSR